MSMYLYRVIHYAFFIYSLFLTVRIVSSWIPSLQYKSWFRFIAFYTDPYLNIFRRIIPPIGGVLDLSPLLAIFGLRMLESMILRFFV